jgi:hypothetical protein
MFVAIFGCKSNTLSQQLLPMDELMRRIAADFALLDLDLRAGIVRLYDEIRLYLGRTLADEAALHARLLDRLGNPKGIEDRYALRWLPWSASASTPWLSASANSANNSKRKKCRIRHFCCFVRSPRSLLFQALLEQLRPILNCFKKFFTVPRQPVFPFDPFPLFHFKCVLFSSS